MTEIEEIRRRKMEELMERIERRGWPQKPVMIGDGSLDDFAKKYPLAVVDCWAPWCGPCKPVSQIIEELAKEMNGKVAFGELNIDENQKTALRYGIMSIPTLLVFKKGEFIDRIIGAMPKGEIKSRISAHLE